MLVLSHSTTTQRHKARPFLQKERDKAQLALYNDVQRREIEEPKKKASARVCPVHGLSKDHNDVLRRLRRGVSIMDEIGLHAKLALIPVIGPIAAGLIVVWLVIRKIWLLSEFSFRSIRNLVRSFVLQSSDRSAS